MPVADEAEGPDKQGHHGQRDGHQEESTHHALVGDIAAWSARENTSASRHTS